MRSPSKKESDFAAREIAALLVFTQKNGNDPFSYRGSSRGAIGLVQFLPSSILMFAVDGNGDGVTNLFVPEDAIPSAANFLIENHWNVSKRAAIWNYSHSTSFVNAVVTYARMIRIYLVPTAIAKIFSKNPPSFQLR